MKRVLFFAGLLMLCLFVGSVSAISGSGTASDPYVLTTPADLQALSGTGIARYGVSSYYELGADIDMSSVAGFTPIGSTSYRFAGHFDGKNHTISNVNLNPSANYVGFFALLLGADVRNIKFDNMQLLSSDYLTNALFAGWVGESNIYNVVMNNSRITTNKQSTSLFIGEISSSQTTVSDVDINNCYALSSVSGSYSASISSLVGFISSVSTVTISNVTVNNCIITGNCYGSGGIIGYVLNQNGASITISNCNVTNSYIKTTAINAAGICGGETRGTSTVSINNCIVDKCTINGNSNVCGIYAYSVSGLTTVSGCTVSDCSIIGTSNVAGVGN